ncbi:PREDICTED: lysophospholipid acyltransferase 5-like [Priapulus caudatus]|uniref:Lysophospholipid acyltransferase 5 n=1 Tax=Priapulus caudatus TaxID=37621 RepID=A0ABM1ELW0_PRICU|nr:PREDICTED: lysophospholipid acyltransferase 5-like [Priapulus caudatus]
MDESGESWIAIVSESLGAPVAGLTLIVSLFAAYPLVLVHRTYLHGKSPPLQHIYFIVTGFSIEYYNFGNHVIHSFICIAVVYAILYIWGGTAIGVAATFVFAFPYLFISYLIFSTDEYDINWTTPHCVLTLRLIALAFDLKDGQKPDKDRSSDQKLAALEKLPSLLELLGNCFFVGGCMIGPQYSTKRYLDFVSGEFADKNGSPPKSVNAAMKRAAQGLLFITIYQTAMPYFPDEKLLNGELLQTSFWWRLLYIGLWGKVQIYKYIASWVISEGSCILAGMTYNGKDEQGHDKWDGCKNVSIRQYELRTSFQGIIDSFNINTNKWALCYVYKRLRFAGNKLISQSVTLLFLAAWHGHYTGYYHAFMLEFFVMYCENRFVVLVTRNATLNKIFYKTPALQPFVVAFCFLWAHLLTGYTFLSFGLLTWTRSVAAFRLLYYIPHIVWFGWPLYSILLFAIFPPTKKEKETGATQKVDPRTVPEESNTKKEQ